MNGPIYLISILENYSRVVLASKISPTQNQWDYLEVLFAAFSVVGVPKAIVSDGGKIFYCNQALEVYKALGIKKERIEKRQAWQNYIETKSDPNAGKNCLPTAFDVVNILTM